MWFLIGNKFKISEASCSLGVNCLEWHRISSRLWSLRMALWFRICVWQHPGKRTYLEGRKHKRSILRLFLCLESGFPLHWKAAIVRAWVVNSSVVRGQEGTMNGRSCPSSRQWSSLASHENWAVPCALSNLKPCTAMSKQTVKVRFEACASDLITFHSEFLKASSSPQSSTALSVACVILLDLGRPRWWLLSAFPVPSQDESSAPASFDFRPWFFLGLLPGTSFLQNESVLSLSKCLGKRTLAKSVMLLLFLCLIFVFLTIFHSLYSILSSCVCIRVCIYLYMLRQKKTQFNLDQTCQWTSLVGSYIIFL